MSMCLNYERKKNTIIRKKNTQKYINIYVTLCNTVTSITAMCVCVSLPCCHLFIPIEASIELHTHNTPVGLSCIHMTNLFSLVKALVVYFFGFG